MPAEIKATERLGALGDLADALSRAMSRREVADVIVERAPKIARADICTVHVPGASPGSLQLLASSGVDAAVLDRVREITPASGNPVLATMATGTPIWVESEAEYRALYPSLADVPSTTPRAHAFWSVPLVSEGGPIGLVGMGFHAPRTFPPDERAFVTTLATLCGEALRRTERAETERAARAHVESLRASFETTLRSIGDAVIATEATGRVTLMNPVAEQLTGWREVEALGQPIGTIFHIVHATTRTEVPSPVAEALREGRIVALANGTLLLHRDRVTETPIEDSAAPIRSGGGAIEGVVLVFRDVSAKKARDARRELLQQAAATLAESLDYESTVAKVTRLAVPTLADWCALEVVDETGKSRQIAVAHVDPSKIELARMYVARYPSRPDATTGVPNVLRTGRSELYAKITDEMLVASARDAQHLTLLRDLRLGSVLFAPLSVRGRVLGVITLVQAESGRHYGQDDLAFAEDLARRCAVAIDNARLYAAELSARRDAVVASRMKDEFLATMSHELRTPLSSIMGWSKLAMGPTADATLVARGLDVIQRNSVAMGTIIEDLLDLSRITSGKIRLDPRQIDLIRVIETAVDGARTDAEGKGLKITPTLAREAGSVRADATRIQQVVTNLLSNAVKFTPKNGAIDVLLRRDGGHVEIEVRDTGKGIDAAFLPHVFEMFQQEQAATARTRGGLGLGLAISKRLVESHEGTIQAFSDGPGRGARFLVRLPAPSTDADKTREPTTRASGSLPTVAALVGIRVLTVDDDDDARTFVKAALELRGATVRTASNVDDALLAIDREVPDVLLSDIGMPLRDGYSLIEELRARPPERGGNVPAAAVSAYAYAHDRERALSSGFDAHLSKPVDPNDLVALVLRLARP